MRGSTRVFDRELRPHPGPCGSGPAADVIRMELVVLDIVYVLGTIVVFAAVGLLGKAVEKL